MHCYNPINHTWCTDCLDIDITAGDFSIENFFSFKVSLLGSRRVARMNDTHGSPFGLPKLSDEPSWATDLGGWIERAEVSAMVTDLYAVSSLGS